MDLELIHGRSFHCSWFRQNGDVVLIGGVNHLDSSKPGITTEVIRKGRSQESFKLEHRTIWACAIQLDDRVIITGGKSSSYVTEYNMDGFVKEHPAISADKWAHGCGSFVDSSNKMVFIITGGYNANSGTFDDTEMLVDGGSKWTLGPDLPTPRNGMGSVSVDNSIFMIGGCESQNRYDDILKFNTDDGWIKIGKLKSARCYHGSSVLSSTALNSIIPFCKT